MPRITAVTSVVLLVLLTISNLQAQKKAEVQVVPKTSPESITKTCKTLVLGKIINNPKPDYPDDAKKAYIGGTVEVVVKIDEKGKVTEVEKVSGNTILQGSAVAAALKAKFSPTVCDGAEAKISGVIVYNFLPYPFTDSYFTPAKIEDLTDISKDSEYFETLLDLVENYKLAYGFADKKFHADAPVSRGDFAHSLRLTLDLLSERARVAGKVPRQINLFAPLNPQAINSPEKIVEFDAKQPYSESVKILLTKYDISLLDAQNKFQGNLPLTNNELIDLWTAIFGEEAVSVNFEKDASNDRIITRGEFALFLQESLRVLTYKVLP
ncbi:MAG TPA: energy transducer TonB [Pyrinomonadaceae bacterium]|nr:energy transducer TonB [Pyrinomonadaceae bacterium]